MESVRRSVGARVVPYRVALVIEGSGSRGMFSAGMCVGFEELGLESVFDAVYRPSGRFTR